MLIVLVFVICAAGGSAAETVTVPGIGDIEGTSGTTYFSNRTIFKFLGIPYAEPPVGDKRFMKPQKATWSETSNTTFNATEYGRACPQINGFSTTRNAFFQETLVSSAGGEEDCLSLDIHTPKIANSSLPVLFYIHGGGFTMGASYITNPDFLLESDVVLVAPQYRLGPLGFLALDAKDNMTWNAGLYDVLMALEFVHEYIQYFGGDPNRITVSGMSAGAALSNLLYVSPLAQDLFSQVMLISGSGIAPWAVDTDPISHSRAIASFAGCNEITDEETLICLRSLESVTGILNAFALHSDLEMREGRSGLGGTTLGIDGEIITELPLDTLTNDTFSGKPMLISITKHEGLYMRDLLMENFFKPNNLHNDTYFLQHEIGSTLMKYAEISDPTHIIASSILGTYFNPDDLGNIEDMTPGIVDFVGAAWFKGPALKTAQLNSLRNGTTYLSTLYYNPDGTGVEHGAEQKYLFYSSRFSYSERDLAMVQQLTKLYMKFVTDGSLDNLDGVQWSPFSLQESNYYTIDDNSEMRRGFEQEFAITEIARRRVDTNSASKLLSPSITMILVILIYQRLSCV